MHQETVIHAAIDDPSEEGGAGLLTLPDLSSTATSDFVLALSHEIRTPLNAILGFAQLLERDTQEPLSDRHRKRVAHILQGGKHLMRLIDDLLDLSRIEMGRVVVTIAPTDVGRVLDDVVSTIEPMATEAGIRVTLELPSTALPKVAVDRTRLVQILTNFGSNGVKYGRRAGNVRITASMSTDEMLRISIRDDGIGVPVDKQERLFEPFQRAGQETGSIEGTGLGLALVKRLAERMAGRVGFTSVPGRGSDFWVELPLAE